MNLVARSEMRNVISNKGSHYFVNKGKETSNIVIPHIMENRDTPYPRIAIMAKGKR